MLGTGGSRHNTVPAPGTEGPNTGSPHTRSISSLALSISPGLRGMVVVADKTEELYKTSYWASYNIPYASVLLMPPASQPVLFDEGSFPRWHFKHAAQGELPKSLSCWESSRSWVTSSSSTCCLGWPHLGTGHCQAFSWICPYLLGVQMPTQYPG